MFERPHNPSHWRLSDGLGTELTVVRYLNNVTGLRQSEPPPPFSGGILADHMGLGKSLTMIALIASDLTPHHRVANIGAITVAQPAIKASLLIVPSTRKCVPLEYF